MYWSFLVMKFEDLLLNSSATIRIAAGKIATKLFINLMRIWNRRITNRKVDGKVGGF